MFDSQKIKKIENFLPQCYNDELNDMFNLYDFDWHYLDDISGAPKNIFIEEQEYENQLGFGHVFFQDKQAISPFFHEVFPIIYFIADKFNLELSINQILRIRAGMNVNVNPEKNIVHRAHVDYDNIRHKTFLYYVNDSDGDTIFYKNKELEPCEKISPKKNTALVFDGDVFHSSSTPKNNNKRITININFIPKENNGF